MELDDEVTYVITDSDGSRHRMVPLQMLSKFVNRARGMIWIAFLAGIFWGCVLMWAVMVW